MTDVTTKKPLHVLTYRSAGPSILLPYTQLDELRQLLDRHGIAYSVDEFVISFNEEPGTIFVNFGRGEDAKKIQQILDSAG